MRMHTLASTLLAPTAHPAHDAENDEEQVLNAARLSPACCGPTPLIPKRLGSRRRRIWELSQHAHCPVIGVCLPLPVVRRLVDKLVGGQAQANDYELHCGVNTDCRYRGPVAEAVQKELDRRYANALRASQRIKTTDALSTWWATELQGKDVAGAFWSTITHPRCDTLLEERVLQDIHMLQHQAGAANRADLARLDALMQENHVLARELAAAQQRSTRLTAEHARQVDTLQAEVVRLRAALISRDTCIETLRDDLRQLESSVPNLRSRQDLAQQLSQSVERTQELERALLRTQHELERERLRQRAPDSESDPASGPSPCDTPQASDPATEGDPPNAYPQLDDHAVLCVGGRHASVPLYRQLVEQTGAKFLHHDGGNEDNTSRLDHTLAAADVVICQTGCISHDAYWRVKDHCKRTGKRCVFVDNPSSASLQRALFHLTPAKE
jgi:TolA-binding protein/anthranilate/para-aminobenzoate synthase component II